MLYERMVNGNFTNPKIKYIVEEYLMGHASLKMTKGVYTDVQEKYIADISTKLNGIFDT